MIEIRNGCKRVLTDVSDTAWEYVDSKTSGVTTVYFSAPVGMIPKIGDFINDNLEWVPLTVPKIIPSERDRFREDKEYTYRR